MLQIKNLNLKQQVENLLVFNGIQTIEQLKKLTLEDLKEIKGLGKKGINNIVYALNDVEVLKIRKINKTEDFKND